MEDTTFVAALQPGGNTVTPRLLRHLNTFCFGVITDTVLKRIFTEIMTWYNDKNHYNESVAKAILNTVQSTLQVYTSSVKVLMTHLLSN
jgi:hypothetical protein